TNRGFDLLHADSLQGPWLPVLRINYFGGFTSAPDGTLWIGDEGGGVYRSQDHGDTFDNVAPKQAVSCLSYAGDALWACTPGTPTQPALTRLVPPSTSFDEVVALADVDHLVQCEAAVDVPQRCAAAWIEWRRDIRMENLSGSDAGALADAATPPRDASLSEGSVRPAPDAEVQADASVEPKADGGPAATQPRSSGGCSTRAEAKALDEDAPMSLSSKLWLALSLLLLVVRVRRARPPPAFR
ncbi:MAG: hypothetical protein JWN04_4510, partial [Myxococcaceae bacterium]|nr:hypothetical protein [Myxococcaceae bacterium]